MKRYSNQRSLLRDQYRVLCFWAPEIAEACLQRLRKVSKIDVRLPNRDYLASHAGEYDAYLAGLAVPIGRDIVRKASEGRLKIVCTPSTGTDHLDLNALNEYGIIIQSIKTDYDLLEQVTSTAELALALMLAAARRIPAGHQSAMRGIWGRDAFRGTQLSGKTLGVLGVGRLGTMMVEFGRSLRMNIIGCDPQPRKRISGLDYVDISTLLSQSDVISIHIHLTPENRHFIDSSKIQKMKPGTVLVNTSRGAIIDEQALLGALESGHIGAAGLDVIDGEWRNDLDQHPLIQYANRNDNLVITPHVGGMTLEAQVMTHRYVADRLADWLIAYRAQM